MPTLLLGFEPGALAGAQVERVREAAPDLTLLLSRDRTEIEAALPDIEVAAGSLPRDLVARASALRWFQQWGAGADWLLTHPEAAERDFVLTNASGVHAVPISEHIFALLLAFARGLPGVLEQQRNADWPATRSFPAMPRGGLFELADKTMLVVGLGAIGERTARLATAFGMHTIGVRRNPERPVPGVASIHAPHELLELLPRADAVVLTVPLTPETRGMIGEPELRAMKDSAVLINIGRGGTIREEALLRALEEGWIGGAGLDVFEREPLPASSPLWRHERVIVTPHYAGSTPRYHERALEIFLDNLGRYRRGEPLRNVVDKELGY